MSAYNSARFNLAKYNLNSGNEVWAESNAIVSFGFSFAGETVFVSGYSSSKFSGEMEIDKGHVFEGEAELSFSNRSEATGELVMSGKGYCIFDSETEASQRAWIEANETILFDPDIILSQIAYAEGNEIDQFVLEDNISQIVHAEGVSGEVFTQVADVISLSETVCAFPDLVLLPGQVLIVDSGSYNVLLDGENAIHLQHGDWIDDLSRNTQSIIVSGTGAGNLQIQILYVTRYL